MIMLQYCFLTYFKLFYVFIILGSTTKDVETKSTLVRESYGFIAFHPQMIRAKKWDQTANFEYLLKFGMSTTWIVYFRFLPGGELKNHLLVHIRAI